MTTPRLRNRLLRASGIAVAAVVAAAIGGCDAPPPTDAKPTPFDTAAAKARAATRAVEAATEQVADAEPESEASPNTAEMASTYEPPFPDRVNPFEPPKKSSRNARRAQGDTTDAVVLLGFAKLDEPRVLLAIDGAVKPLTSGEEAAGVTVLSIAPPRAVLQRGRTRWTASIE